MRIIARRRTRRAGRLAALGALAVGILLLVACGSATSPHLSSLAPQFAASQPLQQATPSAPPEMPTPHGNANSGGSFGPGINSVPLPAGPPTTPPTTAPAPPATAAPTHAPAPPAAPPPTKAPAAPTTGSTQGQPLTVPKVDVRWRLLYAGNDGKLWSIGREGKDPQVVLDKPAGNEAPGRLTNLNLSPDGTRLLYTLAGGTPRVFMLDFGTGTVTHQTYNGAWGQDSRHIITSVNNQLVVVDVTTGTTEALGEGSNANWTTDNQIIAVRQGNLWLIPYPASSGAARRLTSFPGAGAWTFVNMLQYHYTNRIIFAGTLGSGPDAAHNGIRIEAFDMPTGKLAELAGPSGADIRGVALSPSGTQLAVAEQVATSDCAAVGRVQIVRPTGGAAPVQIAIPATANDFYYLRGITWSPDQWLAYSGLEQKCVNGQATNVTAERIFLVNPATPNAPQVFVNGAFPVWVAPRGLGQIAPGAVALH